MAVIKLRNRQHTAEYAYKYLQRGIALTQLKPGSKRPVTNEWQSRVIRNPEEANRFRDFNIGFILGTKSGDLTDIDLDTEEAVKLAPRLLSETPWIFGRKSRPSSHYLYICKGIKTQKFISPGKDGGVILEVRSSGAQTMAPGSLHPDEEYVSWESEWEECDPEGIDQENLIFHCQTLAAACLVLKHGWVEGKRDEVAVSLCGLLLRGGWEDEDIDFWLESIALAAGDEELDMRLKSSYQRERLNQDARVPGIPRLIDLMGKEISDKVIEWLGVKSSSILDEINECAAIIHDEGKVRIWNKKTRTLLSLQDARTWFATYKIRVKNSKTGKNTEKRAFPLWEEYEGREEYDGLIFDPERGSSYQGRLNLWEGWPDRGDLEDSSLEELKGGCYQFLIHLRNEVCQGNKEYYQYLLDWLSHLVQFPSQVPGVALVLRGRKGTGKTIIAEYLIGAIGNHYGTIITNPKHVFGRFNGILRNKLFACIDDIHWSNNHEEEGILKNMITGKQITLEKKFAEVEDVKSYLRLMISTNSEWAAPVGVDERRYFILDLPNYLAPKNRNTDQEQQESNREHFGKIIEELKGRGPDYLFLYLKRRRIKTASFIQDCPITKGYLDSQSLSVMNQDPFVAWIQDCLLEATWWSVMGTPESETVKIPTNRLYNMYLASANNSGRRGGIKLNKIWFSRKFLEEIPGSNKGHVSIRRNGKITTERVFTIPPWEITIRKFESIHGTKLDNRGE